MSFILKLALLGYVELYCIEKLKPKIALDFCREIRFVPYSNVLARCVRLCSLTAYLHKLGVSQSGANKHHTIVQVGQTLRYRGLPEMKDTYAILWVRLRQHCST